jgi:hypothetical protein
MTTTGIAKLDEAYWELSRADKRLVNRWESRGADRFEAMMNSGVLTSSRTDPDDALFEATELLMIEKEQREALVIGDKRRHRSAEHEAAHIVTGAHFGCVPKVASITDDGNGETIGPYRSLSDAKLRAVLVAPEIWINRFRFGYYRSGDDGCSHDREQLIRFGGYDRVNRAEAMQTAHAILYDKRDEVHKMADLLYERGSITF